MRYRPRSIEDIGLENFMGPEQYALFTAHVAVANKRKLSELLGYSRSKVYRLIRIYNKAKDVHDRR